MNAEDEGLRKLCMDIIKDTERIKAEAKGKQSLWNVLQTAKPKAEA